METSTDADLARHPLRPDDTTVAQEDGTPAHTDAGPTHWGEKEGEDPFGFSGCDEDDIPCTQELDPRPLAGGERRGGGGGMGTKTHITRGQLGGMHSSASRALFRGGGGEEVCAPPLSFQPFKIKYAYYMHPPPPKYLLTRFCPPPPPPPPLGIFLHEPLVPGTCTCRGAGPQTLGL